jgi:hypothetical protein
VQVRQIGDLMHPGACSLCGSGNCDRGYVDLGIYFDYEGQVYLCMTCIDQVIETVGGLLPDQALHLKEVSEEIAKKNRELEEENAGYRNKLDSWYTLLDGAIDFRADNPNAKSDDPTGAESSSEPANGTSGGEPVAKESTPKRRPNDSSRPKQRNRPVL